METLPGGPGGPGGHNTEPLGTRPDWFSVETRQATPNLPERVGMRYRLIEQIHQSAMGTVWRAVDEILKPSGERPIAVAVKLVPKELAATHDQKASTDLVRLSKRHPGMLTLLTQGTQEGWWYQVARWLDGQTLEALLRLSPATDYLADIPRWMRQIAWALEALHRAGFVHRDIKPANVMIVDGEAQLIDLAGIRTGALSTRQGGLTPAFASPEAMGGAPADPRDDVYSLAVMAFELLTGELPFPDGRKAGQSSPPRAGLTDTQWHALRRALDRNRDSRATSPTDLVDALWPIQIELPTVLPAPDLKRPRGSDAPGWHAAATVALAAVILGVSAQLSDRWHEAPVIAEQAPPLHKTIADATPGAPRSRTPEIFTVTPRVEPILPLETPPAGQVAAAVASPTDTQAAAVSSAPAPAPAPAPTEAVLEVDVPPAAAEPMPAESLEARPMVVAEAPAAAAEATLHDSLGEAETVESVTAGAREPVERDIALPLHALILGLPGPANQQQQSDTDPYTPVPYAPEPALTLAKVDTLRYETAHFTDSISGSGASPGLPAVGAPLQARSASRPAVPDKPSAPGRPSMPDRPSVPDRTAAAAAPALPSRPAVPAQPVRPERPDMPANVARPERPDVPAKPARPERPDVPAKPARPERPDVPAKPARPERPDVPAKPARPERPDVPAKPARPERPDVPARPARPERPAAPATPARPSTPARPNMPRPPGRGG